ncbi:hypothetical protein ACQPZX_42195 [Actinoplanes sp. CA-142083]|uniref:hypothetical protein n=1 Tax=Actinoplanes sp. CA-142083 TaxID=3239903 RepID=UPI003D8B29C3
MVLFVARDRDTTVISRSVIRVPDGRRVRRGWNALVEIRAPQHPTRVDNTPAVVALIALPPVVVALLAIRYLGLPVAIVGTVLTLLVTLSIVPPLFRRSPVGATPSKRRSGHADRSDATSSSRRSGHVDRSGASSAGQSGLLSPADDAPVSRPPLPDESVRTLTAAAERTAFDRAVSTADRISQTWPALNGLIDIPEAESLLAAALWEISGLLARRQELTTVLAGLTRPDFATLSPPDPIADKLQSQIRATKEALSAVEIDLAAREASLRRAEEAGRTFIREHELREAIRAAERSLGTQPNPPLPTVSTPDAAADLADHTSLVLAAYRELTTTLHPDDSP